MEFRIGLSYFFRSCQYGMCCVYITFSTFSRFGPKPSKHRGVFQHQLSPEIEQALARSSSMPLHRYQTNKFVFFLILIVVICSSYFISIPSIPFFFYSQQLTLCFVSTFVKKPWDSQRSCRKIPVNFLAA